MKPKASRSLRLAWLLAATTLAMPSSQALAARPTSTAFEHQVTEATPGLLSKFSVPGAAVALIRGGKVAYPNEWNVYDSLGEARLKAGDTENAIKNYRMSLKLNPGNDSGRQALKGMGAATE